MRGRACGDSGRREGRAPLGLGIQTFVRADGGYTVVAMALALLLSLTLAFGMAAAHWSMSRGADVQEVADATAMAGVNCVAAYSTIAQVLDACVLTMGLTGTVVCGAALVVAAIPGLQAKAASVMEVGRKVLQARRDFAHSSAVGLRRLEGALPALIKVNSASCAVANSVGGIGYVGLALPFPEQSKSDFSFLDAGPDADEMKRDSEELADASARKDEAHKRAQEAKERAWRADNVDDPMCMWSRAATLAGLGGAENPYYPSPEVWEFEYARLRARNYYAQRLSIEEPEGGTVDDQQRSAARLQYFDYAFEALGAMPCIDTDEEVMIALEELPHNTNMIRETRLYTDVVWPCTLEDEQYVTLHYSLFCPGALGPYVGDSNLAAVDQGEIWECDVCHMDAHAMGNVANASTNITNGFEHYWRIVVWAARDYERARMDEIEAERDMQRAADKGQSAFDQAMDLLKVERPKLCPPGAWGCVAIVCRPSAHAVPSELTSAFLSGGELPAGAAVSAATLAPDESTAQNTILARAFDGLRSQTGSVALDLVGSVTGLWGDLLVGYGSAYGSVESAGKQFVERVEGVFGQKVASWLRDRISSIVVAAGLQPADLRLRKPVIVNSQTVLDKAGYSKLGTLRRVIEGFPSSSEELVALFRSEVLGQLGSGPFTVAELPVPGLEGVTIPLTIDLSELGAS